MDIIPNFEQSPQERRPSIFDYLVKLFIPLLSIAVAIFGVAKKPSLLLWLVLAITLLFLLIVASPLLVTAIRKQIERAKDRRATEQAFSEFKSLVRRFGDFVDTSPNNTLHSIIQHEINKAPVAPPVVPNIGIWNSFWYFLAQRVERQHPSPTELRLALIEFYNLVGSYNMGCVVPLFNYSTPRFREWLISLPVKSSLNEFHYRFLDFLCDCEKFSKALADSRPVFKDVPRNFAHPNPL